MYLSPVKWHRLLGRYSSLRRYPKIEEIFNQIVKLELSDAEQRFQQRQNELVEKVKAAIEWLKTEGLPISQRAIARNVGMSKTSLTRYPRVKDFLKEILVAEREQYYSEQQFLQRQDELLEKAKAIIEWLKAEGLPISQRAIARRMGMSVSSLKCYPLIKDFLKEILVTKRESYNVEQQFLQRQDELVEKVETAIQTLTLEGKRPTQTQISRLVGLSSTRLKHYPKVKSILEQVKQNYRRKKS